MAACNGYDTYRSSHIEGMDPKRLILMLYDGALKHIRIAQEGIDQGDVQKRGENIGRVIAIVSELNACLDTSIQDESVEFLRGLYTAILVELPKVSIHNDVKILDRSYSYIARLKEIWEKNVMGLQDKKEITIPFVESNPQEEPAANTRYSNGSINNYGSYNRRSTSISV